MFPSTAIGIYGISGSGKSTALAALQNLRPEWRCLEGAKLIEEVLGKQKQDFDDFLAMNEEGKTKVRNAAIKVAEDLKGFTVIAGHASFPKINESQLKFDDVFTQGDAQIYKAILYLEKDPDQIFRQREDDNKTETRQRKPFSRKILEEWINHEKDLLRSVCKGSGIYFASVEDENEIMKHIVAHVLPPLIAESKKHSENALQSALHSIPTADVYLLLDGDRTLSPMDTSKIFFDCSPSLLGQHVESSDDEFPLKRIFKRYSKYSFQAFLEVALLYERQMPQAVYNSFAKEIGIHNVKLYQDWIHFLSNLPPKVHPILVSSGNREIWSAALQYQLPTSPTIIAGNHIGLHPYIVDSDAKAMVVRALRQRTKGCTIMSFGDSGM